MSLLWPADSWLYWLGTAAVAFVLMGLLKHDEDRVRLGRRRLLIAAYLSAAAVAGFSPTLAFALRGGDVGEFDPADFALVTGAGFVGVASLFLGAWAVFGDRARGRRRCPKCWYDLSGSPGLTCSECGFTAKSDRGFLRTRRKKWWAAAAVVLAIGSAGMASWSWYRHETWQKMIPTTALILAVPWLDGNMEMGVELTDRLQHSMDPDAATPLRGWQKRLLLPRTSTLLNDPSKLEKYDYGCHLASFLGHDAATLLPLLTAHSNHPDKMVRVSLPTSIAAVVSDHPQAVQLLSPFCVDGDLVVRAMAYFGLRKHGVESPTVLAPPTQLLVAAAGAAAGNGDAQALKVLLAFEFTGESARILEDAARSADLFASGSALVALSHLQPDHPLIAVRLREMLGSDDPRTRATAVDVIESTSMYRSRRAHPYFTEGQPGPYVESLVGPFVSAMFSEKSPGVIWISMVATSEDVPAAWRLSFLSRLLAEPKFRPDIVQLLPLLGPESRLLLPQLRQLLSEATDAEERNGLEAAIKLLDRDGPSTDRTP